MKKALIVIALVLTLILVVPQVIAIQAHAKGLPVPNLDHARGQITTMIVMPAMLVSGLVFALAYVRMS